METTEDQKPDTEELLKILETVKDEVVDTVKEEVIDAETGRDLELKFSSPIRTYGSFSSLVPKVEIKEEDAHGGTGTLIFK